MFHLMFASWPSSFLVLCLSKHIYTCTIYCFEQEIIFTHHISSDLRASLLRLVPVLVRSSAVFRELLHFRYLVSRNYRRISFIDIVVVAYLSIRSSILFEPIVRPCFAFVTSRTYLHTFVVHRITSDFVVHLRTRTQPLVWFGDIWYHLAPFL